MDDRDMPPEGQDKPVPTGPDERPDRDETAGKDAEFEHAWCNEARVELIRVDLGHVRLTVSDKGVGFDPAGLQGIPKGSFGLFSLREQSELMGGQFEVRSAPGQGTEAVLIIPG